MSDLLRVAAPTPPPLDPGFRPAVLGNRAYREAVRKSGVGAPVTIVVERTPKARSVYRTEIFAAAHPEAANNAYYLDRVVKFLLWQKGGHRVIVSGPPEAAATLKQAYAPGGSRAFDAKFMGGVFEAPFAVEAAPAGGLPDVSEPTMDVGRHLNGCRIGLDLGASDRKVAAVIDGKAVHSEEIIWHPRDQQDPDYHFGEIQAALKSAASHMPRVDGIGVSSAGVYINNRVMVASLFRGVPADLFEQRIKGLFFDIQKAWGGIPLEVVNDGEVTALAGAMTINDGAVLGIAMGSSEAAGYVTPEGKLTDWLDELAFAPVDFNPAAAADEWSGDIGCGVQYFTQVGAIRLATAAGIDLAAGASPAEKLKLIQAACEKGDDRAAKVFQSIGCCLGYTLAHYADFYEIRHVLLLGRVVSGKGGDLLMERARAILKNEFPELNTRLKLHLPENESERRVGQAIAAASLPAVQR